MGALDGVPMGLCDINRGIVGGCLGWFSDGTMGYKLRRVTLSVSGCKSNR